MIYFPTAGGPSNAVTYALAFLHAASFFGWIIHSLIADHLCVSLRFSRRTSAQRTDPHRATVAAPLSKYRLRAS